MGRDAPELPFATTPPPPPPPPPSDGGGGTDVALVAGICAVIAVAALVATGVIAVWAVRRHRRKSATSAHAAAGHGGAVPWPPTNGGLVTTQLTQARCHDRCLSRSVLVTVPVSFLLSASSI